MGELSRADRDRRAIEAGGDRGAMPSYAGARADAQITVRTAGVACRRLDRARARAAAGARPAAGALASARCPRRVARPPPPRGRELELDARAVLPAAARRDRAARRRGRARPTRCMLDAARRTKDEQLFRRATEIALQARAGDQALAAVARLARRRCPSRPMRLRYQVQLLVALNRIAEVEEPLSALLRQHGAAGAAGPDRRAAALLRAAPPIAMRPPQLVEQALRPYADDRRHAGRRRRRHRPRLAAGRRLGQGARLRAARAAKPTRRAEGPALLALDLLPGTARGRGDRQAPARGAEPDDPTCACSTCARWRTSQRLAEATAEIEVLTRSDPDLAPPWLTLGALAARDEAAARSDGSAAQLRRARRGRRGRELRRRRERAARQRRRRGRHAAQREHGVDAGVPAARPGGRAAAGLRRRRSAGSRASTTRSERSRCRRAAPRCWRARAS